MKKKHRLQMLTALLAATLSIALTSPIAAKANEEYNVDATKESNAETGRIYYLKNSHGDVIGQMDENGTVLTSYAYNAFGEQVSAVATKGEQKSTSNRFLYAGEQYDETSCLYYLRARHYDVKAGRFTQEDTYLGDGRNLYAYVHSNPLKYVDPTGHNAAEIFDGDDSLLDDFQDKSVDGGKGTSSKGFSSTGYTPQSGERKIDGYVSNNATPEVSLTTKSVNFNNANGSIGGEFKRIGAGTHAGISPHVHQPVRNVAPTGIYGGVGTKTSNGGVTSPTAKDVKQLYEYVNNQKY